MSGKCKEVCIQILHIDWHMRGALCTVHNDHGIFFMRHGRDLFDWIDPPKDIGNLYDCDDLRLFCNLFPHLIQIERSIRAALDKPQFCSCLSGDHLPWQKIAVVLHDGDKNFVPFFYIG